MRTPSLTRIGFIHISNGNLLSVINGVDLVKISHEVKYIFISSGKLFFQCFCLVNITDKTDSTRGNYNNRWKQISIASSEMYWFNKPGY